MDDITPATADARLTEYDPLAPAELSDPYPTWAAARAECPVFRSDTSGLYYLTRDADVRAAVRDTSTFSSAFAGETFADAFPAARRPELDDLMSAGFPDASRFLLTTDAPHHTARRRLAQVAFTPARVAALEPTIVEAVDELCRALRGQETADLLAELSYPLTTRVIAAILGLGQDLVPQLRSISEDLLVLSRPAAQELTSEQCDEILTRVRRISAMHGALADLVTARRRHPEDDVLTGLLEARVEGEPMLEDADVLAIAFELVLAGTDTTANLIAHAVLAATRDPALWRGLADDPDRASAVVEETLRLRGSSKGLFRVARSEVEVDGVSIPAGSMLQLLFGSANHDETVYEDPDDFVLDRPGIKRHLAFGLGAHFCLGAPLARVETRVALQGLSRHFPALRVPPEARLSYLPSPTTLTLAGLPVHLA